MKSPSIAAILVGDSPIALWSLRPSERLRRSFARRGVPVLHGRDAGTPPASAVVLVRADHVYEDRVIAALIAAPDTLLVTPGPGAAVPVAAHIRASMLGDVHPRLTEGKLDGLPSGLRAVQAAALAGSYEHGLRKREAPYVMAVTADTVDAIERRMFAGAYKGATDLVTKYVWPRPALAATRWAAAHGISPNAVTAVSLLCVLAAFLLFMQGQFIAGLIAAWLMTFLDTVDGKLARVTLTSTRWGNVFDHGVDLIHPPFWYAAWAAGLWAEPEFRLGGALLLALVVIVAGYILGRLQEGLFIALFKVEMHVWRPVDTWFRLVTARRNPNLLLLTLGAVVGRPDLGFAAVALWTVISLLFHSVRIAQAVLQARSGPVRSWLAEAP